jgi:hypothetical protein
MLFNSTFTTRSFSETINTALYPILRTSICAVILTAAIACNPSTYGCSPGYSSNQDSQCSGSQYGYSGFQSYQNAVTSQQSQCSSSQGAPGYSGWQGCSGDSSGGSSGDSCSGGSGGSGGSCSGGSTAGGSYLYVTTKEAPNLQTRVGYSYSVQTAIYTGRADFQAHPNGQYEVVRYFEQRFPNFKYGTPQFVSETTLSLPMQSVLQWLVPGLVQSTMTVLPSSQYGRETIALYWDASPNPSAPWYQNFSNNLLVDCANAAQRPVLLDSKQVLVYPASSAISQIPFQPAVALNGTAFAGDPPRVTESITNAYPGGTTWVVICPGSNSGNATTVANTQTQAGATDLVASRMANVDVGSQISAGGAYTVQVLQSTAAYGVEELRHDTFTVNPNYLVNSELGVLK